MDKKVAIAAPHKTLAINAQAKTHRYASEKRLQPISVINAQCLRAVCRFSPHSQRLRRYTAENNTLVEKQSSVLKIGFLKTVFAGNVDMYKAYKKM